MTAIAGVSIGVGRIGERIEVDFSEPTIAGLLDTDSLYADILDYKVRRGYGNVYVPRQQILPMLSASTLYMLKDDLDKPHLVQEGAARVLKTYLDRFAARKERRAETRHLEPGPLIARERVVPYKVRASSEELLKELEKLLKSPKLYETQEGKPLPRLHLDRHLFSPLLLNPQDYEIKGISLSPPGLREGEAKLVKDLWKFWQNNHSRAEYRGLEINLLRNLPRVGVGFFGRSGFYPDFILWIKERRRKLMHVRFLEPHGLHHGGLAGNQDKFEALRELRTLNQEAAFKARGISMSGYLLTETALNQISDAGGRSWDALERECPLLRQSGEYIKKILDREE